VVAFCPPLNGFVLRHNPLSKAWTKGNGRLLSLTLEELHSKLRRMSYKTHVFICTAAPDKPGKCGNKGSEGLRKNLKERCQNEDWGNSVRINSAGCLGHCEKGISTVIYPEGLWDFHQTPESENSLFEKIKAKATKD
jgi:predicted metal-binding protein